MTIELQEICRELNEWRNGRSTPGRIPGRLKQKVLTLTKHYSQEKLIQELPLKANTLKGWQQPPRSYQKSAKFIALTSSRCAVPVAAAKKQNRKIMLSLAASPLVLN